EEKPDCSKAGKKNKNPAARCKAKRRGRNREEAKPSISMIPSFPALSSVRQQFFNRSPIFFPRRTFFGVFWQFAREKPQTSTLMASLSSTVVSAGRLLIIGLMSELQTFLETCERAVRAAGATIRGWIGKTSVQNKGPADFVTEADFAAQEVVKTTILHAFPRHSVLGEEDQLAGDTHSQTDYRWIVDPLDGTTNFVHGIPHYAVSLALEHRGELLVGAIFDPSLDECFTAALGQGAFLNGRPIHTTTEKRLSEVIAGTDFPANLQANSADLLVFNKALFRCQGVRRTGSA